MPQRLGVVLVRDGDAAGQVIERAGIAASDGAQVADGVAFGFVKQVGRRGAAWPRRSSGSPCAIAAALAGDGRDLGQADLGAFRRTAPTLVQVGNQRAHLARRAQGVQAGGELDTEAEFERIDAIQLGQQGRRFAVEAGVHVGERQVVVELALRAGHGDLTIVGGPFDVAQRRELLQGLARLIHVELPSGRMLAVPARHLIPTGYREKVRRLRRRHPAAGDRPCPRPAGGRTAPGWWGRCPARWRRGAARRP